MIIRRMSIEDSAGIGRVHALTWKTRRITRSSVSCEAAPRATQNCPIEQNFMPFIFLKHTSSEGWAAAWCKPWLRICKAWGSLTCSCGYLRRITHPAASMRHWAVSTSNQIHSRLEGLQLLNAPMGGLIFLSSRKINRDREKTVQVTKL